jgi:hypothetical protein
LLLVGAAGCAAVYRPQAFRSALDARDLEQAERLLDAVVVDQRSGKSKQAGHDVGRLLLKRGSVRMALGDFAGSRWSNVAWEALPAHVHWIVLELAPGSHHIGVEVRGERRERDVRLAPLETRGVWIGVPH